MRLETRRLILREFEMGDWRAAQLYETDPEVVRYQSFNVMTEAESKAYIARTIDEREASFRRTYDLAITLRDSGELVGRIGLCHHKPEAKEAMLWYLIRRDQWGQGLMSEAVRRVLEFGFEDQGLRRIVADTDPMNAGSIRVLLKNGFRQEAHHVRNVFIKGAWIDTFEFAILAEEFSNAGFSTSNLSTARQ